jgi:hypothetical protein
MAFVDLDRILHPVYSPSPPLRVSSSTTHPTFAHLNHLPKEIIEPQVVIMVVIFLLSLFGERLHYDFTQFGSQKKTNPSSGLVRIAFKIKQDISNPKDHLLYRKAFWNGRHTLHGLCASPAGGLRVIAAS